MPCSIKMKQHKRNEKPITISPVLLLQNRFLQATQLPLNISSISISWLSSDYKNTTTDVHIFLFQQTRTLFIQTLQLLLPLSCYWRRKWQTTPVFSLGESHGQRSLVGCCPWGWTESDITEEPQYVCVLWRRKWEPTPVFLPGESQGRGRLVGCHLSGRRESDTTEVTQQQQQQYST